MTWRIGFKRNENSNLRRGLRMRANNAQHSFLRAAFLAIVAEFFGGLR